ELPRKVGVVEQPLLGQPRDYHFDVAGRLTLPQQLAAQLRHRARPKAEQRQRAIVGRLRLGHTSTKKGRGENPLSQWEFPGPITSRVSLPGPHGRNTLIRPRRVPPLQVWLSSCRGWSSPSLRFPPAARGCPSGTASRSR